MVTPMTQSPGKPREPGVHPVRELFICSGWHCSEPNELCADVMPSLLFSPKLLERPVGKDGSVREQV